MKNALIVGIDKYSHNDEFGDLSSCEMDAKGVSDSLGEEFLGIKYFDNIEVVSSAAGNVNFGTLEPIIKEFFENKNDLSLFYFSGHASDGYLRCTDSYSYGSRGIRLDDLMGWVEKSETTNKIIILDCCNAGEVAENMFANQISSLPRGVTILAASDSQQNAAAGVMGEFSVFTEIMLNGLSGAAANALGKITPASLYAKIDESLGMTRQRPVFKSNTVGFVDIKHVKPKIGLDELKQGLCLFDHEDKPYGLDYTYEPERNADQRLLPKPIKKNVEKFKKLQKLCGMGLVKPSKPHEHMYWAAMADDQEGKCELTEEGQHYFRLVVRGVL